MITQVQFEQVLRVMPALRQAPPTAISDFKQQAFFARIPAGHDVFLVGDAVESIALLLTGVVRVYKVGETGREITLYRFGMGESCILSANAIFSDQRFSAIATVEQAAEAVMIPAAVFRQWVRHYDLWHAFLFTLLSQRLAAVMEIIDAVTFHRMDLRIAGWLVTHSATQATIRVTHQEIADELGSSREVVSRILETIAQQGLIQVRRGMIDILDRARLQDLALM